MEPQPEAKLAELEALLFVHGEPLPFKKIAAVLNVPPTEIPDLVAEFKRRLEDAGRGLALVADRDSVQLVTKPALAPVIQEFVKRELTEDLTPASLEALSLIAYLGPLPRAKLDYLRGVNSSFILRNLMMRGLVERIPDPQHSGAILYQATIDLWKHLGLSDREQLPEYARFRTIAESPDEVEEVPATSGEAAATIEKSEGGEREMEGSEESASAKESDTFSNSKESKNSEEAEEEDDEEDEDDEDDSDDESASGEIEFEFDPDSDSDSDADSGKDASGS